MSDTRGRTPIVDPTAVAVTPDGSTLLVVHRPTGPRDPGELIALDSRSFDRIASVTTGFGANGVAVTPDGAHAYVTNAESGTVSVIDIAR